MSSKSIGHHMYYPLPMATYLIAPNFWWFTTIVISYYLSWFLWIRWEVRENLMPGAERLKVLGVESSKCFYSLTCLIVAIGSQLEANLVPSARTPTCGLSMWPRLFHNIVASVSRRRPSHMGAVLPFRIRPQKSAASFLLHSIRWGS